MVKARNKPVDPNDITRENGDDAFLPEARIVDGFYDRIPLIPAVPVPPELGNVRFYLERINQEKAALLMKSNFEGNRPIVTSNYQKIKTDIENDDMAFNGSMVRLDDKGNLIDGQHRMMAASNAEPSNPFWVPLVTNLPTDVYATIDTGAIRNFSTYLRSRGSRNALIAAAVVNRAVHWQKGYPWLHRGRDTNSTSELQHFFCKWEEQILEVASIANRNKTMLSRSAFTPSLAAFMLFFCGLHVSHQKSLELWDHHVGQGLNLTKGHPAEAFLRRMHHNQIRDDDNTRSSRVAYRPLRSNEVIAYALATWMTFIKDETTEKLQSPRSGGWTKANFEDFLERNDLLGVL